MNFVYLKQSDRSKSPADVEKEGAIIAEMVEIVDQRDSLRHMLEEDRQRWADFLNLVDGLVTNHVIMDADEDQDELENIEQPCGDAILVDGSDSVFSSDLDVFDSGIEKNVEVLQSNVQELDQLLEDIQSVYDKCQSYLNQIPPPMSQSRNLVSHSLDGTDPAVMTDVHPSVENCLALNCRNDASAVISGTPTDQLQLDDSHDLESPDLAPVTDAQLVNASIDPVSSNHQSSSDYPTFHSEITMNSLENSDSDSALTDEFDHLFAHSRESSTEPSLSISALIEQLPPSPPAPKLTESSQIPSSPNSSFTESMSYQVSSLVNEFDYPLTCSEQKMPDTNLLQDVAFREDNAKQNFISDAHDEQVDEEQALPYDTDSSTKTCHIEPDIEEHSTEDDDEFDLLFANISESDTDLDVETISCLDPCSLELEAQTLDLAELVDHNKKSRLQSDSISSRETVSCNSENEVLSPDHPDLPNAYSNSAGIHDHRIDLKNTSDSFYGLDKQTTNDNQRKASQIVREKVQVFDNIESTGLKSSKKKEPMDKDWGTLGVRFQNRGAVRDLVWMWEFNHLQQSGRNGAPEFEWREKRKSVKDTEDKGESEMPKSTELETGDTPPVVNKVKKRKKKARSMEPPSEPVPEDKPMDISSEMATENSCYWCQTIVLIWLLIFSYLIVSNFDWNFF